MDDARRRFRRSIQAILLAALGRTIAQTVGDGVLAVELEGEGRSVLRPDVDVRRTVGWFTTYYPVPLACAKGRARRIQQLDAVHNTLKSVPHYGIGYGLLRYLYAPTGRVLGAQRTPDIHFRYAGMIPELPSVDAPVQFDSDMTMPVRETIPGLGHAIELRAYRSGGLLHLDWWYDTRRIPAATAEALVRTFPLALSELIQEGIAAEHDEHDESEMSRGHRTGRSGGPVQPGCRLRRIGCATSDMAVVVRGIRKTFGKVVALDDVSFDVGRGEVIGLLGPNGAGKTTMVDILSTLTRPDQGSATVAGYDVVSEPAGVRRSIMVTGQQVAVDDMTYR